MIRSLIAAALAAGCFLAPSAQAQTFDAARALSFCTEQGMFGHAFGEPQQAGGRIGLSSSQFVRPAVQYAPFAEAELVFTHRSQALHSVVGIASLGSPQAAASAHAALIAAAGADQRFVRSEGGESAEADALFFTSRSEGQGLRLEVSTMGGQLVLGCVDAALRALTFDELAGRDSGALQRPTPPHLSLPAAAAANTCEAPDTRGALLRDFEESMEGALGYGQAAQRYGEALATYKGRQMVQRGIWTDEERVNFDLEAALNPAMLRESLQGMQDLSALMRALETFRAAQERGEEASACTAALNALALARGLSTGNERQWRAIAARYDAEARRRGAEPVE